MARARQPGSSPWRVRARVVVALACGAAALAGTVRGAPAQSATGACVGDCEGSGNVTAADVMLLVTIALGRAQPKACMAGDANRDGRITIEEILAAVLNALTGCTPAHLPLQANVHFDQTLEPINYELLGTDGGAPLASDSELLRRLAPPPRMRLDVGFEGVGCPGDSSAGTLYDAATNSFNYCQLDERLRYAAAVGATPLLIIDYMPPVLADPACAATGGHSMGVERCPPANYDTFQALVTATVMHAYAAFGVTDFEVWNEPDGTFFAGTRADYLRIYATCNAALTQAEAGLGLPPGTLHLGGPAALLADRGWITSLLGAAVADPSLRLDFISWHIYADNPFGGQPEPLLYAGLYADSTRQVASWLAPYEAQRANLRPLLWIDEWNVNAFFDHRMDTAYEAAFLAASLHAMQDAGLDRAARFNTWDSTPASPLGFNGNWGFFTNDGQVRPAFGAFALWDQLGPVRVAVELLDAAAQGRAAQTRTRYRQNLIAARDAPGGRAAVLLYNFVSYSPHDAFPPYCGGRGAQVDAALNLLGLADGTYTVTREQVDCTTPTQMPGTVSFAPSPSSVTVTAGQGSIAVSVPPDGVVLLSLGEAGR